MSLLDSDPDFGALRFRNQRRNLKPSGYQTGKTNRAIDIKRKALLAGKRMSKSGNIYYENRSNRSDLHGNL